MHLKGFWVFLLSFKMIKHLPLLVPSLVLHLSHLFDKITQ